VRFDPCKQALLPFLAVLCCEAKLQDEFSMLQAVMHTKQVHHCQDADNHCALQHHMNVGLRSNAVDVSQSRISWSRLLAAYQSVLTVLTCFIELTGLAFLNWLSHCCLVSKVGTCELYSLHIPEMQQLDIDLQRAQLRENPGNWQLRCEMLKAKGTLPAPAHTFVVFE